jgi:hypothetical protein
MLVVNIFYAIVVSGWREKKRSNVYWCQQMHICFERVRLWSRHFGNMTEQKVDTVYHVFIIWWFLCAKTSWTCVNIGLGVWVDRDVSWIWWWLWIKPSALWIYFVSKEGMCEVYPVGESMKREGPCRRSNPGPLEPKSRIIPLDHRADTKIKSTTKHTNLNILYITTQYTLHSTEHTQNNNNKQKTKNKQKNILQVQPAQKTSGSTVQRHFIIAFTCVNSTHYITQIQPDEIDDQSFVCIRSIACWATNAVSCFHMIHLLHFAQFDTFVLVLHGAII